MNRVIDCRLVVDEVIQQWNQCAALFFVPSVPLWHLEKGRQSRKNRRRSEDVPLGWSGSRLFTSDCSGSSAILGLHHEDYCNTVQMGPCCNRLGRVDWTNWRGVEGLQRSGDGRHHLLWGQATNPGPAHWNHRAAERNLMYILKEIKTSRVPVMLICAECFCFLFLRIQSCGVFT